MACVVNQVAKAFEDTLRSLFCLLPHLCRMGILNMMNRIVIKWSCSYSLIPKNAQLPYQQLKGAGMKSGVSPIQPGMLNAFTNNPILYKTGFLIGKTSLNL